MENLVCTSCKKAKFPFYDLDNLDIEKSFLILVFHASVHMIQNLQLKEENLHSNISRANKIEIIKQSYQKLMNF